MKSTLPDNLLWSFFKNAGSQIGGRLFLTGCRFIIAIMIIRQAGVATYGEYALILSLLLLTECLVDFGMSDSVVRMMCQEPHEQPYLFRLLIQAKAILACAGVMILVGILWLMDYPTQVLLAGLIAALSLLAFAGILVFRTLFKVNMQMEREVVAEILSVVVILPCIPFVATWESALIPLMGCYVFSRFLFLCVIYYLGRSKMKLGMTSMPKNYSLIQMFKQSFTLGVSYFLIRVNDVVDPILLSKMTSSEAVGHYLGCMRFIALLLMVAYPISTTAFPILSSYWQKSMDRFAEVTHMTFQVIVVVAAWGACVFHVSAGFFLGLMDHEMLVAKDIFRTLTVYAFLQSIMAFMGSLMIVSGGYKLVIIFTCIAVMTKFTLLLLLVPEHGAMGAAYASLATECAIITLTWGVVCRKIGFGLGLKVVVKVALIAGVLIQFVYFLGMRDHIVGGLIGGVLFPAFIVVTRTLSIAQFKQLIDAIRHRSYDKKET